MKGLPPGEEENRKRASETGRAAGRFFPRAWLISVLHSLPPQPLGVSGQVWLQVLWQTLARPENLRKHRDYSRNAFLGVFCFVLVLFCFVFL